MKEIQINDIIIKGRNADKFEEVKNHMESIFEEELDNKFVAWWLIDNALINYRFE